MAGTKFVGVTPGNKRSPLFDSLREATQWLTKATGLWSPCDPLLEVIWNKHSEDDVITVQLPRFGLRKVEETHG